MTFSDFSINITKIFYSKLEVSTKFVYFLTTSNAEPEVNPIVFVTEPTVKNLIV